MSMGRSNQRLALVCVAVACVVVALPACSRGFEGPLVRPIQRRPTFPNLSNGPVVVVGQVRDPGIVPWFRGMGVEFAITARGGMLPTVDPIIEIRRLELGKMRRKLIVYQKPRVEPEFELAPGDIVVINPIVDVGFLPDDPAADVDPFE
jgi:hypothetical protein